MTPQEALQIVASACAEFRGTLKDHQTIQEAIKVMADVVNPPAQPAPPVPQQ